jgi:hypothetical protein
MAEERAAGIYKPESPSEIYAKSVRFAQRTHVSRVTIARQRGVSRERRPQGRRTASSASRDGPRRSGEPEPPLARCVHCGAAFTSTSRAAKFCSSPCRQAAYRRRQAPSELADVVWKLRHDGEIDGVEALLLLIAPPADVLARIESAA